MSALYVELRIPAYLTFAGGVLLSWRALQQTTFTIDRPVREVVVNDEIRLENAVTWVMEAVIKKFEDIDGHQRTTLVVKKYNRFAASAGWSVTLDYGGLIGKPAGWNSIIELGENYAAALGLLLDMCVAAIGRRLTIRVLQTGYDALPWEEREIGEMYCFRHIKQARELSEEFTANRDDYMDVLCRMPLFASLSDEEIHLILSRLKREHFRAGRVIIRQGDRGDCFYIIQKGHVEVTQRDEIGGIRVVNRLSRGDYFGELALLRDAPRNATCKAVIPTDTLTLSRADFDELVKDRFVMREKVDESISRSAITWPDNVEGGYILLKPISSNVFCVSSHLGSSTANIPPIYRRMSFKPASRHLSLNPEAVILAWPLNEETKIASAFVSIAAFTNSS